MATVAVRHIVDDVKAGIAFYTTALVGRSCSTIRPATRSNCSSLLGWAQQCRRVHAGLL